MNYSNYWSILDSPSNSTKPDSVFLIIGLVSLALGLLIKKYKTPSDEGDKTILLWGAAVFGVISFAGFFYFKFAYVDKSDEQLVNLLNSSKLERIEGIISNFNREYRNNKIGSVTIESFNVDTVFFKYEDALFGRFNSFAKTNNGIFHNGLPVRITYNKTTTNFYPNSIMKVEIGK